MYLTWKPRDSYSFIVVTILHICVPRLFLSEPPAEIVKKIKKSVGYAPPLATLKHEHFKFGHLDFATFTLPIQGVAHTG